MPLNNNSIYKNKKVLVTGNTGFKGSWLSAWLSLLGANVYGLSYGIPTRPSHFETAVLEKHMVHYNIDVRSLEDVKAIIAKIEPDFVFHLAAQPIVHTSYNDPVETIETNVVGTMNILEALRTTNHKCTAIMITSDKCYDNVEWVWGYRETDALGGDDPYSASKGAAEIIIKTYARSFFDRPESNVKVASVRAGNVIGGGDWAKDRIVPDCMRSWDSEMAVKIRSPNATRPWQHVLEPLSGYLRLGQKLYEDEKLNGEAFNFGPATTQNYTVAELIREMQKHWENGEMEITTGVASGKKEANLLKLCCDKALHLLDWQATLDFEETVKITVDWYRSYYSGEQDIFKLTCDQIKTYTDLAMSRDQHWVKEND